MTPRSAGRAVVSTTDSDANSPKQLPKLSLQCIVLPSGWLSATEGSSPLGDLNANIIFPFPGTFFACNAETPLSPSEDPKRKRPALVSDADETALLALSRFV
jgi:hypothetical protein